MPALECLCANAIPAGDRPPPQVTFLPVKCHHGHFLSMFECVCVGVGVCLITGKSLRLSADFTEFKFVMFQIVKYLCGSKRKAKSYFY